MARILVVDDDDQVRTLLCLTLERAGYEVTGAADGAEALRVFEQEPVELVITDIVMPEKEGLETIMEFRKRQPELKIIAISGGGRIGPEEYLSLAKDLGASKAITKPVEQAELIGTVKELLGEQT